MFKYLKLKNKNGFSTVEVLATALVFSIAAIAIAGITAKSLQLQRRATATQKIQENATFVLEYMAREIRISSIRNQDSNCAATVLNLTHPINGAVSYNVVGGTVIRTANGLSENLSSNDIQFSRMLFCIRGSPLGDDQPTRITILTTISDRSPNTLASINLQTTVVTRVIAN